MAIKKKVYILQTTNVDEVARKALEVLNEVIQTSPADKKILLKPNAVGPYLPSAGVTTSPAIISSLRNILSEKSFQVTVGDCPGESSGSTEEIFIKTEILTASGTSFINLGQQATLVNLPRRKSGNIAIAKAVMDSDIVVSLAKLKTSCFMMISGAVKNLYGIIPGTQKARIHDEFPKRDDFADILIDIAQMPKKVMAVIDGSTLMEGNGPVHGKVRTANIYIISEDIFAADYAVAQLLGMKINDIPVLKQAQKRGLLSPENIEIISDVKMPLDDISLPITLNAYLSETAVEDPDARVEHIASVKIVIDLDKCTRCGHCASICPAHAIKMEQYPVINHEKCIRCFCCNELCSVGAAKPEENIKKLWDNIMTGESKQDKDNNKFPRACAGRIKH